jgi:hypothetical protein
MEDKKQNEETKEVDEKSRVMTDDEKIDEAGRESFPASDPPAHSITEKEVQS